MTFARIEATGAGRLRARAMIAGFGEIVSAATMTRAAGDYVDTPAGGGGGFGIPVPRPERILGLDVRSLKFGARADLMRATVEGDPCGVKVLDLSQSTPSTPKKATMLFAKRPQIVAYLRTTVDETDVTIAVSSTADFASSGVIHIGTEAIKYTGKTATTFTGCTRGVWGSTAIAHYVADGAGLAYPRVTEVPESLEGRRVEVHFYGDGDPPQEDGTLVWRGIASTDASYDGAGSWKFTLDPISRLLDAQVGASIDEALPIRGIYYPVTDPFLLVLDNMDSVTGIKSTTVVKLTGFFETQQEFCDELTTQIAAAVAAPLPYVGAGVWQWSAGSVITARPSGPNAWELVYFAGAGAGPLRYVAFQRSRSFVDDLGAGARWDPIYGRLEWRVDEASAGGPGVILTRGTAPTGGATYVCTFEGIVPRGATGRILTPMPYDEWHAIDPTDPTADSHYIYVDGYLPSALTVLGWIYEEGDDGPGDILGEVGIFPTTRALYGTCSRRRMGPRTRIRLPNELARGTVEDFRQALIADSPAAVGKGLLPLVTSADILALDVDEIADSSLLGKNRIFMGHPGTRLGDVISPEVLALGCFQRINAGAIEWVRLHGMSPTDPATWTIGESDIDRSSKPMLERGADGLVSTVKYRTGYDPAEDDWKGPDTSVRDVQTAGSTCTALTVEVAQRSFPIGRTEDTFVDEVASPDVVAQLAMPLLALFGAPYDRIGVVVGMRYFGVKCGDVVSLTCARVPNTEGTLGVENEVCLVTGHSFDGSTRRVTLELLRSGQHTAGYAPSFQITAQTNVAGNIWDVTVNLADYTDETDVSAWLTVGDLIGVVEEDSASPVGIGGSVTSFPAANKVRVTLNSAWTPGTSGWGLRARTADQYNHDDPLGRFFFNGSTAAVIDYADTTLPARVLSA